ncbi:hypothetical protein ARTHRO9V_280123 [Arthrobacter sp. 9V]|nr:hypothetical protein ARTHRO9V_280123 [Arthrobacter sp. 9V]
MVQCLGCGGVRFDLQRGFHHCFLCSHLPGDDVSAHAQQCHLVERFGAVAVGECAAMVVLNYLRGEAFRFLGAGTDEHGNARGSCLNGSKGAALSHQHVHGSVLGPVGDDGHQHAVFLDAGHELLGESGILANVGVHGQGGGVKQFERWCCVHGFVSFAEEWLVRERCDPASYFLSSPVVFWLLAKLAELWPTEACLPLGKVWEIPGGNKRRRSAVGKFLHRRPRSPRRG